MKRLSLLALTALASASALAEPSSKTVIANGTVIDPGTGKVIPTAALVIEGDRITSIVQNSKELPKSDTVIDARGKFILPGYIDTHVHFFQSGDIYTRPDAVDLNSVRPYAEEHDWIERNLRDTFARYL
ncbi:MAG TPA: hypothetical protein VF511_04775, partial [Chthoniobacterales bacterium]